jgi:hypothetical protein
LSKFEDLIRVLISPDQRLEDAAQQVLAGYQLDSAIGAQLDVIGLLVGQERAGLSDSNYRRYIRARISANRSSGTVEEILQVIGLVLNDLTATLVMQPQPPASFALRVDDVAVNDDIAGIVVSFLRESASAGVRAILESSPSPPVSVLRMSLSDLSEPGQNALGISSSPEDGGLLSRAVSV